LEKNKGFAEDLTEGKFSFPIIHGIRSHPENNQIMNILSAFEACDCCVLFYFHTPHVGSDSCRIGFNPFAGLMA